MVTKVKVMDVICDYNMTRVFCFLETQTCCAYINCFLYTQKVVEEFVMFSVDFHLVSTQVKICCPRFSTLSTNFGLIFTLFSLGYFLT